MEKIIYYDKLFPIYDNKNILTKVKIDKESVSYISSPIYAEKITNIIINHTKTSKINILDCTAGCGGDTISFLNKFKKVYSIEKNPIRFTYLMNNIKEYNLTKNSIIFNGNFEDIIKNIKDIDVMYIDPPWGGSSYKKQKLVKLKMNNVFLDNIILNIIDDKSYKQLNYIILKLPNNYDIKSLYELIKTKTKITLYNLKKMIVLVIQINKENYLQTSSSLVNPVSVSSSTVFSEDL